MIKNVKVGTLLAGGLLTLAGCSQNIVDGKANVEVPQPGGSPAVVCHLLEIDREDGSKTENESYFCVSREEWDRNHLGDEWVDANGKKK